MPHIRTTKTSSSSIAVQVVRYELGKTIIIKHIGSAANASKLLLLKYQAEEYIEKYTGQQSLFTPQGHHEKNHIIQSQHAKCVGIKYNLLHQVFRHLFTLFAFDDLKRPLLNDLVMVRIINPSSKLQAIKCLKEMFDIKYSEADVYRKLLTFPDIKENIEKKIIAFAKENLDFDFTVVCYDVTTLYFESFKEDKEGFRKPGFSKDNKFNQPQIVIGLIVNKEGFPVSCDIYSGNVFEGHTIIPSLTAFKKKHQIQNLTVVADAAMISINNVNELISHDIQYIVGARISNLPDVLMKNISRKLNMTDGANCKVKTDKGLLVCDFSKKRYWKNKNEMENQLIKARKYEGRPDAFSRKIKFLKNLDKTKMAINQELIEKTKMLLGIKGYYTNLSQESNETIISQYHNLWHVEKAFRMAKSDLEMRPIYHFNNKAIQAHILICFMALAVATYIELSSNVSIQKTVNLLKQAAEVKIKDTITGKIITIQPELSTELQDLLTKLHFTY